MSRIPIHVAEAFAQGEPACAGAFVSHGDSLYSYNLKLAHLTGGEIVLDHDLSDTVTQSTATHISALVAVLLPDSTAEKMYLAQVEKRRPSLQERRRARRKVLAEMMKGEEKA